MSALIVPIDVMAYCVSVEEAREQTIGPSFAGAMFDYSRQSTTDVPAYLGVNVLREVFDESQGPLWPLEKGVHLHWAVPSALTQGQSDPNAPNGATRAMQFPALPNRWLVTRIVANPLGRRQWIIESDTLASALPSDLASQGSIPTTVPTSEPNDPRGFRYLGATKDFDAAWSEPTPPPGQSLKELTGQGLHAVANGDVTFAAFYPNSRSIFGFHDDLADLAGASVPPELTYVVTGWYGTPADDPLFGGVGLGELQSRLKWTFAPTDGDEGDEKPDASLYSGLVQGVVWNPDGTYIDASPLSADIAIGNHPAEAIAAYVRGKLQAVPLFEDLLTLYAGGLLPEFNDPKPSQLAVAEEALHEFQFDRVDGGSIYTIRKGTTDVDNLPPSLADALNALNLAQQAVDALSAQAAQSVWRLYSTWTLLFLISDGDIASKNAAIQLFNAQDAALKNVVVPALADANQRLNDAKTAVTSMLAGLELVTTPAERFRTPNEPVVVLAGDAAAPARRYKGGVPGTSGSLLPCRLDSQLLVGLTIDSTTMTAAQFATLLPPAPNHLPGPAIGALIQEAALLDTAVASILTGIAESTLASDLDVCLNGGEPKHYAKLLGVAPAPLAVARWSGKNPWCSIMLLWEIHFRPLLATRTAQQTLVDYPADFFTANYALDPNNPSEIAYQPGAGGIKIDPGDFGGPDVESYRGAVVLSSTSADNLRKRIEGDPAFTSDQTLQAIDKQLQVDLSLQGLSGLNDALLSRRRGLQLPIGESSTVNLPLTRNLSSAVQKYGPLPPLAPDPNGFYNAVRAGYFKLDVKVMDPFGLKRGVDISNLYVSNSLTPSGVNDVVYAQPRLMQPSRLLWRWVAADSTGFDEMNAHPATTPVCGWLIPSHTTISFFVYNAQGNPLGSLTLSDDLARIVWQAAPGDQATIDLDLDTVMAHQNPHLRDLTLALGNTFSPAMFQAFYRAVDSAAARIAPATPDSQSALASLVGRPLAIVQTSLRLERQGLAALDNTYATAFTETDHALSGVQFPVVVGDLARLDDGLVGFFKMGEGGAYDTSTFYCEAAIGSEPGVVAPETTNLLLTPVAALVETKSTVPETKLLMLVDPRTPVHATIGILPTSVLTLPPSQYQDLLTGIELYFPVWPVLRPNGTMALPFPAIAGFNQSWITEEASSGGAGEASPRTKWVVDPDLDTPTARAVWEYSPQSITEGWLRLNPEILKFRLTNNEGDAPVVTAGNVESLTLTLTNARGVPIVFASAPQTGVGPEDQPEGTSVFYMHIGSLVDDADVSAIALSAPGWKFVPFADDTYGSYWAAFPDSASVTLAPGQILSIQLSNVAIGTKSKPLARVYFDYYNLTGCDDGVDEAIVAVLPAASTTASAS